MVAVVLSLGLLAGATLFAGLGRYPLWEPDEARHAEIARELSERTTWILPTLHGRPYHGKPILYYWLTAAAYRVGGRSTTTARVVSASAALLTLVVVFAWAFEVWGLRAAALSALTLLTTIEFLALGRFGDLNMLLTLWVTAGVLGVHHWTARDGRGPGLLVAAVACGLGALTKGLVSPALIGGVAIVDLWRSGRLRLLRRPQVVLAAAMFAAVAVPWYVVAGLHSPGYLRDFFLEHHLRRALGGRRLHPEPFWFTTVATLLCFLPWTLLLPAAVHRTLRDRRDDATAFCLLWAAVVVVLFTLPTGKLATYVLPAMPPLALVVGRYWSKLTDWAPDVREAGLLRLGLGVLASVALVGPVLAVTLTTRLTGKPWVSIAALSAALLPFGIATAWLVAKRLYEQVPPLIVAAMLTVCVVFYGFGAPAVSAVVSDAPIARMIAAADPSRQAPVVAFRTFGGSLPFYLDRPVHLIETQRRLRRVLSRRSLVFIVTHRRHLRAFRRMRKLYPWRDGRHVLLASQPPAS